MGSGDFTGVIRPILDALPDILAAAVKSWWGTADVGFGKLLLAAFGAFASGVWWLTGGAVGHVNVFTQIPPDWSYNLAPLRAMQDRLRTLAVALVGLSIVLSLLWVGAGTIVGIPFGRTLNAVPRVALALAGLGLYPQVLRWWIDLCNAASGVLLSPETGLPGLRDIQGYDRLSALGAIALVYALFACWFLVHRLKLVVTAGLLLGVAPLAIAVSALPFPLAQRFGKWWLTTFLSVTLVGVLQAGCLALASALMASTVVTGALDTAGSGVMAVALGVGSFLAALSLPRLLQAGVVAGADAGWAHVQRTVQSRRTVAQATSIPVVSQVAVPRHASIRELPAGSGYTRSLLAEGVTATARV